MTCHGCGGDLPSGARFCPSCGASASTDDAMTMGVSMQATRPSGPIGVVTRRTPTPAAAPKSDSGWLTSSDSISHGRFPPGTLLDGRYRIIGLLGKGGMGEVYRADDLRLGQPVALKFLPEGLRDDPVRLAQFHNEVRTARQVSHANVCRVHDIGEVEGLLYLSMEYVDGEDLASSLRRIGRFPEDKATEIARQLCAGVAAAHQRGVIHRDLKPANVMLDAQGRVRIMDFGLAAAGRIEDVRAGTPAYMAPEQLLGREVTQRSDIFALGLVLYELFTGRRAFVATTVGDLVNQYETAERTAPSTLVGAIDPAVDRAILRCLDADPERRPGSPLAVAAALPGGDPLAAMLAAGETPSPEMVIAAGEGAGLRRVIAWSMLLAILVGIAATLGMALRTSPLDRIRPEYSSDVLAQKVRDAMRQLGYESRSRDEAYGFQWNNNLIEYVVKNDTPVPRWREVLNQRPSPLSFWYRQSDEPFTAITFHTDLLTPGIVTTDDPPTVSSGMVQVDVDHQGRLTFFEAIPPQHQDTSVHPAAVDWRPLFQLAGLDQTKLTSTDPTWTWLAASDTRAAWTGVWPDSGRPLRVEAAAFGGRPVAFMLAGPWFKPWRMAEESSGTSTTVYVFLLLGSAVGILIGAAMLARRNIQDGKGDRRGAARLAVYMASILMALWACQVHLVATPGFFAMFLLAVCTSVFYGVLLWTIYLALEPFVRRQWPQVLVSWTSVLTGRFDAVVGRDVLIGVALGVWFTLLFRIISFTSAAETAIAFPGDVNVLLGLRSTLGVVLEEAPYAIRNVLLYFFILFVFRVLLRNRWAAMFAFTAFFAVLQALGNDRPWLGALLGILYFGSAAVVIVRFGGLLAFVVGAFVSALLFDVVVTVDTSVWYLGNTLLLVGIVVALAIWGFYVAVGRNVWTVPRHASAVH